MQNFLPGVVVDPESITGDDNAFVQILHLLGCGHLIGQAVVHDF